MFFLFDKPSGITSHDVVDRIRKITKERKVGHGGTLDPFASGLLIIAVGRDSTSKLGFFLGLDKEYEAEITLGEERITDDITGEAREDVPKIKRVPKKEEIISVLESFIGEQNQVPPFFSAIKNKGVKSYELARKGKFINLKPRKITIYSIRLLDYQYPRLKVICRVSSGTYIRSLARDIGRKLKTGAFLSSLRRISIGEFNISQAVSLDSLKSQNWKSYAFENL
jgi:tRNA pseudouridine55 synthase